jgi:hypothetical protein
MMDEQGALMAGDSLLGAMQWVLRRDGVVL